MKYEKFKIINMIKEFILNVDKNLTNFPKKEIELKRKIVETSYELLAIVYEGNITENMKKRIDLRHGILLSVPFFYNVISAAKSVFVLRFIRFPELSGNNARKQCGITGCTENGNNNCGKNKHAEITAGKTAPVYIAAVKGKDNQEYKTHNGHGKQKCKTPVCPR